MRSRIRGLITVEERQTMYDTELWHRAACPADEKKKLIPVIELLIGLAGKAIREGLLAIEDDLHQFGIARHTHLHLHRTRIHVSHPYRWSPQGICNRIKRFLEIVWAQWSGWLRP